MDPTTVFATGLHRARASAPGAVDASHGGVRPAMWRPLLAPLRRQISGKALRPPAVVVRGASDRAVPLARRRIAASLVPTWHTAYRVLKSGQGVSATSIAHVSGGERRPSSAAMRAATQANPRGPTPRQREILLLVAEGLHNTEIADRLSTTPKT